MQNRYTRRQWIVRMAATPVLAAGTYNGDIIDTHVHFYDPGRAQGVPWPPEKDSLLYKRTLPADFREVAKGLGVTGVIIVEASAWVEDNQWVLDLAKDDLLVVGVVGNIEPGTSEFATHLKRFAKNPLFRGIRIGGKGVGRALAEPAYFADLQRLSDAGLQLDTLGDYTMLPSLLRLTERLPKLRVVIDHLPLDAPTNTESSLRELAQRPSVYAKVSNVLRKKGTAEQYHKSLDSLWKLWGPDRLIYGSNWPVSNRMGTYREVLQVVRDYFSAKGEDAARRYFAANAAAAYKWRAR